LNVFFHHLSSRKVPTDDIGNDTDEDLALCSVIGLAQLGHDLEIQPRLVEGPGLKAWPAILRWCQFLVRSRLRSEFVNREQRLDEVFAPIAVCWDGLCQYPSLCQAITSTPEAIEMVAKMWIYESTHPASRTARDCLASSVFLTCLVENKGPTLDKVVETFESRVADLVKAMISNLRLQAAEPIGARRLLATILVTRGLLCADTPKHQLRGALLKAGVVGIVTQLLVLIAPHIVNGSKSIASDAMASLYECLYDFLHLAKKMSYIVQSIRGGLLRALVVCGEHLAGLSSDDRDLVLGLLVDILCAHLVYLPVLSAVRTSLEALLNEDPMAFDGILNSPGKDAWNDFYCTATSRARMAEDFALVGKPKMACGNPKCLKFDLKDMFMKCSGCRKVVYCSKRCQGVNWKGDHRSMCKLNQAHSHAPKIAISRQNRRFIHQLASSDIRSRLSTLQNEAKLQLPGDPIGSMLIQADYTVVPPVFSFCFPSHFNDAPEEASISESEEDEDEFQLSVIKGVLEQPACHTVIAVLVRSGDAATLFSLVSTNFWTSDASVEIATLGG
ncbi:hypothetical protein JAAARDRAFT_684611, partial [Jaapia argillacea MUCL 33604]